MSSQGTLVKEELWGSPVAGCLLGGMGGCGGWRRLGGWGRGGYMRQAGLSSILCLGLSHLACRQPWATPEGRHFPHLW